MNYTRLNLIILQILTYFGKSIPIPIPIPIQCKIWKILPVDNMFGIHIAEITGTCCGCNFPIVIPPQVVKGHVVVVIFP